MTSLPEDYQEKSLKTSILASVPNGIVEENRVQLPFGKIYEAMIGKKTEIQPFFLQITRFNKYRTRSSSPVHSHSRKRVLQKLRFEQNGHRPPCSADSEDSLAA